MATETSQTRKFELGTQTGHWVAGGLAGFLAGGLFGGAVMNPAEMMPLVATLYGLEGTVAGGVVAGWIVHLFHSIVFGLVFVGLAAYSPLGTAATRPSGGAVLGLLYGIVIWAIAAVIIMPAWVGAVTPMSPPVPNFNWVSFVGHAVYGIALGTLYPLLASHEV